MFEHLIDGFFVLNVGAALVDLIPRALRGLVEIKFFRSGEKNDVTHLTLSW
jgi:hypothetical protein